MTERKREELLQQRRDFAELMKHYPFTMETLAGEEWRDIEGYDGKYQISNYSRVKSLRREKVRILTPRLTNKGYLVCRLKIQGKEVCVIIHRLVAKAFIPNLGNKPEVNHIDGIKWNACVTNLEWTTKSENQKHSYDTGLHIFRQNKVFTTAKLTDEQIEYIRNNAEKFKLYQLAEKFGVSEAAISMIQRGLTYSDVSGRVRARKKSNINREAYKEIYRLFQTDKYTRKQLSEMFGVTLSTIGRIIRVCDKELGLTSVYKFRVPDDIRNEIRRVFKPRHPKFGACALGRKFGVCHQTILNIVNEK